MPNKNNKKIKIGLSSLEATRRLKQYGENVVFKKKKFRPLIAFIEKFNSPLLMILIFASLLSFFVGEHTNAIILISMILLSVIIDFVNTYRSQKAVEELAAKVVTTATVYRDGSKRELILTHIVPGDVVFLSAGDVVPADCRILEAKDFHVNEAALTGESFPAEKMAATPNAATSRANTLFMGTSVVAGYATAEVTTTGRATEFGKIADRLAHNTPETDFEKNMKRFSFFIMQVTLFLVLFVFLTNAFLGRGWLISFIFAIAIAIGLTPELLPVIISVSLSHGSIAMAKKNVIVKNLPSIQNFGGMNILCSDKTGTLTQDKIVLVKYINGFGDESERVLNYAYINSYFHSGVKNPLDTAIKSFKKINVNQYQKIDEIPFDFERRRGSIVVAAGVNRELVTKGAPEEMIKICNQYEKNGQSAPMTLAVSAALTQQFQKLSQEGFRVLAVATKNIKTQARYRKEDETDALFLGFVAFLDPPKETAASAIAQLEALGIEIKILTGDNELLTEKICRDIKLPIKGIITGEELSTLKPRQMENRIKDITIFARIKPEQKEQLILALKKTGNVVGYLGDGINDAPALKAADVGLSVNNAVDVAKETADIILLQKSLMVLKDGIIEGRKTFHNTMKYIMMGLSSNFGNMFSMMGASALLPFLPMLPTQVLLNNFLYDSSQLSLPSDTVDEQDIQKPTAWDLHFIRKYMAVFGLVSSLFDFLTFAALLLVFHLQESQFQTGWFIESIATQVFVVYVIRTKRIPFIQSRPSLLFFINTFAAVLIAWFIPWTSLGALIGFQPLPPMIILSIAGITLAYLILAEIVKRIFYTKLTRHTQPNLI